MSLSPLVITTGEPAGVGPELALLAAQSWQGKRPLVLIGDLDLLESTNQSYGLGLELQVWAEQKQLDRSLATNMQCNSKHVVNVLHTPLAVNSTTGVLNVRNAPYVLSTLDIALSQIESGHASGMVTCPVHKGVINQAGIVFTGHTEYLAQACCVDKVVMLLADAKEGGLKVALATTHLPLSKVPAAITQSLLAEVIDIIHQDFKTYFLKDNAHIWVLGLNPHAGESGHMGREEIETIEPAIHHAQHKGIWVTGPYPADTAFGHRDIRSADVILAMYHDQGLPVLKYSSFGHAVNVTLGLPIIRTSVDHGTALDIAGKRTADVGSLLAAIKLADHMANCKEMKV